MMTNEMTIRLVETKSLGDGLGFVSRTKRDNLPVYSASKILDDTHEGKLKWKIGLSVSSGCRVGCIYCYTNSMTRYRPLRVAELVDQVRLVIENTDYTFDQFDEVKVSFKQMGDPSLNPRNVAKCIAILHGMYPGLKFVVSTSGPRHNGRLFERLACLVEDGVDLRLQFSCHTTSDVERMQLSPKLDMLNLAELAEIANAWPGEPITLNFVMIDGFTYDGAHLGELFHPEKVFVKINFIDVTKQTTAHALTNEDRAGVARFIYSLTENGFRYASRHTVDHYRK